MANNQDTYRIEHVIDLHVIANTFAQPNLQQLINQVQLLTWAVLATQGSN